MSMENVFVPENRTGWWGGTDTRPRCSMDDKVVFVSRDKAEESAAKIRARDNRHDNYLMTAYQGKCGNWHVGHSKH